MTTKQQLHRRTSSNDDTPTSLDDTFTDVDENPNERSSPFAIEVQVSEDDDDSLALPPVETIFISKSSDIRKIMDNNNHNNTNDLSLYSHNSFETHEPLSKEEKQAMSKFLMGSDGVVSTKGRRRRNNNNNIIAVYPDPEDPSSMVEIFCDKKTGRRKKKIHRPKPKKMTTLQKLGLQSCRRGGSWSKKKKKCHDDNDDGQQ